MYMYFNRGSTVWANSKYAKIMIVTFFPGDDFVTQ